MKTLDVILQGYVSDCEAIDFLKRFDFSDSETIDEGIDIMDIRLIESHDGIDLYYHKVADYYLFSESND